MKKLQCPEFEVFSNLQTAHTAHLTNLCANKFVIGFKVTRTLWDPENILKTLSSCVSAQANPDFALKCNSLLTTLYVKNSSGLK